jgi:hypothetical protein
MLGYVKFEVLKVVPLKITVFWDTPVCSLVDVYRRFEETYCLNFENRKVSRASNKQSKAVALLLLAQLNFDPEEGGSSSSEKIVNFHQNTRCHILLQVKLFLMGLVNALLLFKPKVKDKPYRLYACPEIEKEREKDREFSKEKKRA